jgi:hypothetical protein
MSGNPPVSDRLSRRLFSAGVSPVDNAPALIQLARFFGPVVTSGSEAGEFAQLINFSAARLTVEVNSRCRC